MIKKNKWVFLSVAFLIALLGTGCTLLFGKSNALQPNPLPGIETSRDIRIRTVWSKKVAGYVYREFLSLRPSIDETNVYTLTSSGDVRALHAQNGRQAWRLSLKTALSEGGSLSETDLWAASPQGDFFDIDTQKHVVRWQKSLTSQLWVSPQTDPERVALLTNDGILQVLSRSDGHLLWQYHADMPRLLLKGSGALLFDGDALYAGFPNGRLIKFNAEDGVIEWEKIIAEPHGSNEMARLVDIKTQPISTGIEIFAASYQGQLVSLEEGTGELFWSHPLSTDRNMAYDDTENRLFVVDVTGRILAFSGATGHILWEQEGLIGRLVTSPVLWDNRYVLVGDLEGFVHGLDPETGKLLFRKRVGNNPIVDPILVSQERGYALDEQGRMLAFDIHERTPE